MQQRASPFVVFAAALVAGFMIAGTFAKPGDKLRKALANYMQTDSGFQGTHLTVGYSFRLSGVDRLTPSKYAVTSEVLQWGSDQQEDGVLYTVCVVEETVGVGPTRFAAALPSKECKAGFKGKAATALLKKAIGQIDVAVVDALTNNST